MRYFQLTAVAVALGIAMGAVVTIAQQHVEKTNMDLVGYDDLQARSAYQPVIQKQGERWIAYVGHHGGDQAQSADRQEGTQRDVDRRRDQSETAEVPGPYSGRRRLAVARRAARRWCASAPAARTRAQTKASSTCCAASARRPTKPGTSRIRQNRAVWPSW